MSTEVYTSHDKETRDKLYEELRAKGDENERQAVKFSGNELVLGEDGQPIYRQVNYTAHGKGGKINVGRPQRRLVYHSTWSVAHPTGRS